MLNAIILNVIMLCVVFLSAIMLSVAFPYSYAECRGARTRADQSVNLSYRSAYSDGQKEGRHDTQHNDIQHTVTQHNDTQHKILRNTT